MEYLLFTHHLSFYILAITNNTLITHKFGVNMSKGIKRVQVTFTKEQYELIQKLKGELGNSDSEVIKSITIAWLTEKSFISTTLKEKLFGDN